MNKPFEITFKGTDELLKLAEKQAELLRQNVETAVYDAMLLGIARIANDAPVDTGRLRASIAGDYAEQAGVQLTQGKASEGKTQSVTKFDKQAMEARIGTNVEYAIYQEYGTAGRAIGKAGRSGATLHGRGIKGKGFFRRNIPVLQRHFNQVMDKAVKATREGKLLREGD